MQVDLNNKTWFSPKFTSAYQLLDEKWHTKLALYRELCEVIQNHLQKTPISVLDLGGGLGTSAFLAKKVLGEQQIHNWVVFDLAKKMMEQGSVYNDHDIVYTRFVIGNLLLSFPFKSKSFDVILSSNVLYQFTDDEHVTRIVPELLRTLNDGGILLICNPVPKTQLSKIIFLEGKLRSENQSRFGAYISVFKELLKNLPFLSLQRKLVATANKKRPEDWALLYTTASNRKLNPFWVKLSAAYAEQVGIVGWYKSTDENNPA